MKVAITGTSGYIAQCLKRYFELKNMDTKLVSVRNFESLDFRGCSAVVHCAAAVHRRKNTLQEKDFYVINTQLTEKIAADAKRSGVGQFIFLSTMSVYGINSGRIDYETPVMPVLPYGKTKLMAEKLLLNMETPDFSICILRPPMVYGRSCPGNYSTLRRISLQVPVFPKTDNERSMIYIENLCDFIYRAVKNRLSGLYFPQNKEYVNTADLAYRISLENNKRLYLSPFFGAAVKFLPFSSVEKAFCSLTYDKKMSDTFDFKYCIRDFESSINKTECGG